MARDANRNLKWIREHEEEFLEKYLNKYLLIRKARIEGVFDDHAIALSEANRRYGKVKFIIYHVENDKFINSINDKDKALIDEP